MNKGLTGVIISLLLVLSVAFAILYISANSRIGTLEKDLRTVIDERENQLINLKADLADMTGRVQSLDSELEGQSASLESLSAVKEENDVLIADLEKKIAGRDEQISSLEAEISDKSGLLDSLSASLDEKYAVISSLSAENREQAGQISTLTASVQERDVRIQELTESAVEKDQQIAGLQKELEHYKAGAEETKKEPAVSDTDSDAEITADAAPAVMEPAADVIPAQDDQSEKIVSLTADVEEKEKQIAQLTSELSGLKDTISSMDADSTGRDEQIEKLNADLADRDSRIEQLNADLAERESQIESLNADLSNREGQIEALKADIVRRAGENVTMSSDLSDKEAELESLNARMETLLSAQAAFDSQKTLMKQWFIETIAGASAGSHVAQDSFSMRFRVRAEDRPNVRSEPGTSGKVVGHASSSVEYEVIDVYPGVWLKIRLENGKVGWISSKMGTLSDLKFSFESAEE